MSYKKKIDEAFEDIFQEIEDVEIPENPGKISANKGLFHEDEEEDEFSDIFLKAKEYIKNEYGDRLIEESRNLRFFYL